MPDSPHIPTFALIAFALAILFTGVLAGASNAFAAGPTPIVDETPDQPTAVPAALQGKLGNAPSDGAKLLTGGLTAKADRLGAGFPAYSQLLGSKWKSVVAAADRKFASKLDASEAVPEGGGKTLLRDGSKLDEFDRVFKISDQIKGKGGKQTRELKVAAFLDGGCPRLQELGGFGWEAVARATYEVTTMERSGRYDIVTAVVIDANFESRPRMLRTAVADDFHTADFGEIKITRNQVAVDRKTGKRSRIGETERFRSTLDPFYQPEGDFLRFIMDQEDGKPVPPRRMRAAVWDEVARNFMAVPYDAVQKQVLEGEKLARTVNRCVKLDKQPNLPTHLAPGETIDLKAIPRSVEDPRMTPFPILERVSRFPADWINWQGQESIPLGFVHEMENGRHWYRHTAPPQPWPANKPAGVKLGIVSAAGIGSVDITFLPESPKVNYAVTDASFATHTSASRPHSLCGEVGGEKEYDGSFAGSELSSDDYFSVDEDGQIEGQVEGSVSGLYHDHRVFGCDTRLDGDESCEATLENRTKPDSVWVGFSNAADPSKVKLTWAMENPEVGYQDAGNDECNAYVWGYFDEPVNTSTIDRSKLQGSEPITLTTAGTGHIDEHAGRDPASIDHSWQYSITLQPVDGAGNPLAT